MWVRSENITGEKKGRFRFRIFCQIFARATLSVKDEAGNLRKEGDLWFFLSFVVDDDVTALEFS